MGTSNSCAITNEEKWEEYIEQTVLSRPVQSLLIPGTWLQGRPVWPRSHLNSSKPVSSIDLHTQVSLQSILPEAISLVYKTEGESCSVDPTTNSETIFWKRLNNTRCKTLNDFNRPWRKKINENYNRENLTLFIKKWDSLVYVTRRAEINIWN